MSKTKDKDSLTRFRKKVFESWTDVLDTAAPPWAQGATEHTRISAHYFFHSTIILTLRVSRVFRDAKKLKKIEFNGLVVLCFVLAKM